MEDMNKQTAILENNINDIPLIIDPCRLCKKRQGTPNGSFAEECFECCYFYGSKFEAKEVQR
jgi:hypothetical protein